MKVIGKYVVNLLITLDQAVNTILGGAPDETLSSRMGKVRESCSVCYWICRALHLIDPSHCEDSIEEDRGDRAIWRW